MSELRCALIRLAHENESLRPHLLPILKEAVSQETVEFVEWVVNTQEAMHESEVRAFITRVLGMEIKPPIEKRQGPRFQVGDRVEIMVAKHKDAASAGTYQEFDGKIGTVTDVDGMDALVKLDSGPSTPVRFPNAQKASGVGIMKYTEPFVLEGSKPIEMIYFAGGDVKDDQKIVVDTYMDKGRPGEQRSANFYTGSVFNARLNQKNEVYFQLFPQQRMRIDPKAEGGFQARSFNPSLGQLLYIGLQGRRPSHWKQELGEMKEQMAVAG